MRGRFRASEVQANLRSVRRTTIWLGSRSRKGACVLQDFESPRERRPAPRKESDGQSGAPALQTALGKSRSEALAAREAFV